jgi:hypothetical protein
VVIILVFSCSSARCQDSLASEIRDSKEKIHWPGGGRAKSGHGLGGARSSVSRWIGDEVTGAGYGGS